MINVTLTPLYPRKETRYPLNRRLGGVQSLFGRLVGQKISCLYPNSNPGSSSP